MEFFIFISMLFFNIPNSFYSYNIDISSPYFKSIQLANESLFGFSINIFTQKDTNKKYILAGAPFDSYRKNQRNKTGALYACPTTSEFTDCASLSFKEYSEGSLFGYVVDSNSKDGAIYTCAPRFLKTHVNIKYVEGACWVFDANFEEVEETISNGECLNSIMLNSQNYEYRNCLTGSALKSLNNKEIIVTAPYANEGRGILMNSVFNSDTNSRLSNYLNFNNTVSKYQMTGFSMSVGKVFRDSGVKTILMGTPGISQYDLLKTSVKFGQVNLVKLNKKFMEHSGIIYGEQFGSGFGYSVLAMDLNGDEFDDVIVGAPFANNNNGQVYVYWNADVGHSNSNPDSVPLDFDNRLLITTKNKLSRSHFGTSLENIGDINKDNIMDLAVGAPFDNDGSGAVYIYLGNKNGILALSQKIEGRMISPDLRGFGFSIFGNNEDLDSNGFPDFIVGAALSSHVVGLRTAPIIRIYAENMISNSDMLLPYTFENLQKCPLGGHEIPCIDLNIYIYYYYPYLNSCLPKHEPRVVDYQIELDSSFLKISSTKRVYFEDNSVIIKGQSPIKCKVPNSPESSPIKTTKIFILDNMFFNISVPIEVSLKWDMKLATVPKRDFNNGPLADLSLYPVLEKKANNLTNKINFGAGCSHQTCKPIITVQPSLSLPKQDNEYLLYIGNTSSFKLDVHITNIVSEMHDKAYRTFIKLNYQNDYLNLFPIGSNKRITTQTGVVYSVTSPLNPQQKEIANFVFSLSNDFIQSAAKFINLNISVEAMTPQKHLAPINLKIRIKMVADIDLKAFVTPESYPYKDTQILGFDGIKSEEKVGPKMKFTITLSNLIPNSSVLSSKLLIYFPWETAGNPKEPNGQFLLYLLRIPKFKISLGNKKITCDADPINKITNIINTRIYQSNTHDLKLEDVLLKNISLPDNRPQLGNLTDNFIYYSANSNSKLKTDWERIILLDCLKGSARCIPIVCDLGPLSRQSGEITFEFDIRIWVHTLIENFLKYKFVYINIPVYWIPLVNYDIVLKDPQGNFKSVLVVAANIQTPKPPPSLDIMYAIIIAVTIGVILLATLVIVLYQCKFFRRQKIGNRKRK